MKSILTVIGKERVEQFLKAAAEKAVSEQHAAGLPSVGLIAGVLSMRFGNGRVVAVDSDEGRAILRDIEASKAQRP